MPPRIRQLDLPHSRLEITELGEGVPVIMCHGFPGLGYSWRHQLTPIANAGFRAVAPDMLGYGGSSAPAAASEYSHGRITDDLVGLLDSLDAAQGVFVGQDFGAPAVWNVALRAPERVAGLALLSVPFDPARARVRPSESFARTAQRHFLHTHYFQAPGVADAELAGRPREFLLRLFHALSGAYRYVDIWREPSAGNGYLDVLPAAPPLPWPWLAVAEFDHYAAVFARTGFTGGLNWYRAIDLNWEADLAFADRPIEVPTVFIAGTNEPVLEMVGAAALDRMLASIPDLRGVHLVEGAGHWVQQERPAEVNRLLGEFLGSLDGVTTPGAGSA